MEQAWLTARLNAYAPARSDKFTKLESLLAKPDAPSAKPQQSPEQQIAVLKSVMAARRR